MGVIIFYVITTYPKSLLIQNVVINTILLIAQVVILNIYFIIRKRKFLFLTKGLLGAGDLLFFCAITPLFHPINFLLFMVASNMVSLTAYFFIKRFKKNNSWDKIPLVSTFALCLIPLLWISAYSDFSIASVNHFIFNFYISANG